MNEWQPFWQNLTGQIASLSQRYLPEQKDVEGWLSRFLPSSNLAKKDSSKSSSQTLLQNYESEQSAVVVESDETKPKRKKRKPVAAINKEQITKDLETELRATLEIELKTKIEAELKSRIEAELKSKFEAELKPEIEAELKSKLVAELEAKVEKGKETKSDLEDPIKFNMDTKRIVEAILFAAEKPMTSKHVQQVFPELERPELQAIQVAIDSIIEDYAPRPISLKRLASGYTFQVNDGYSYWVARLFEEKPPKYSRALLETIAIIAYRQPVTRGDIEDIRGVSVSSNIIRTLLEREWIRVIAHKEVPGRPALYGSTKQFLDYFNISSLDQLPTLEEIKELDFSSETSVTSEKQKSERNPSEEQVSEEQASEEQTSEEQTSEKQKSIEPVSETRH